MILSGHSGGAQPAPLARSRWVTSEPETGTAIAVGPHPIATGRGTQPERFRLSLSSVSGTVGAGSAEVGHRTEVRSVASCYPSARLPIRNSQGTCAEDDCAHYLTFSHTRDTTLIFPSPANGAAADVYTSLSPSFFISLITVVPVHTSFQEMSM
jgi:hypothetical protein